MTDTFLDAAEGGGIIDGRDWREASIIIRDATPTRTNRSHGMVRALS